MIENSGNNLINTSIGSNHSSGSAHKSSVNQYYNIFSGKLETIDLPDIDLEYNNVLIPEKSTFMRTA